MEHRYWTNKKFTCRLITAETDFWEEWTRNPDKREREIERERERGDDQIRRTRKT